MPISERHVGQNASIASAGSREGQLVVFCQQDATIDRVTEYCDSAGYAIAAQRFSNAALQALGSTHVVMLEDGDAQPSECLAERACLELRARHRANYVMVFADQPREPRERALMAKGADYYLAPLEPQRLSTYLTRLMARPSHHPAPPKQVGPLVLDGERRVCYAGGNPLSLTATEFDILSHLVEKQGYVVWLHELAQQVLACNDNEASRARVRQHVYALKKKSATIAALIRTVRRCGYLLEAKREPRAGSVSGISLISRG